MSKSFLVFKFIGTKINRSIKVWNPCIVVWMIFFSHMLHGQSWTPDTVVFHNGFRIVGEILWMENNRLQIDPDYVHGSLEAKWNNITGIKTNNAFQISLMKGPTYYGSLNTLSDGSLQIITQEGDTIHTSVPNIVLLRPIDDKFIEKLSGSIALGFDLAKARDLRSLTMRSEIGYKSKRARLNLTYDALSSRQTETENILRSDASLTFIHTLPKRFFAFGSTSALSNTQQKLDIRWNIMGGGGSYLADNQKLSWVWGTGINHNTERFSDQTEDRRSWEAVLSTDFEIFRIGDLKLKTSVFNFLNLTESGRWRTDIKFDIRYNIKYLRKTDLDNKIFVKLGFSSNYDNQPAENATKIDYVFNTTIGFSWNE